jgi:hypothetical protein
MFLTDLDFATILVSVLAVTFLASTIISIAVTVWADVGPTTTETYSQRERVGSNDDVECLQCSMGWSTRAPDPREYLRVFNITSGVSAFTPRMKRFICYSVQTETKLAQVTIYNSTRTHVSDLNGVFDPADGSLVFIGLMEYNATLNVSTDVLTVTGNGQFEPVGDPPYLERTVPRNQNGIATEINSHWTLGSLGVLPPIPGAILNAYTEANGNCCMHPQFRLEGSVAFVGFTNHTGLPEPFGGFVDLLNHRCVIFDLGDSSSDTQVQAEMHQGAGTWLGEGSPTKSMLVSRILAFNPATRSGRYFRNAQGREETNLPFSCPTVAEYLKYLARWEAATCKPTYLKTSSESRREGAHSKVPWKHKREY